jgi:hypothetical protein
MRDFSLDDQRRFDALDTAFQAVLEQMNEMVATMGLTRPEGRRIVAELKAKHDAIVVFLLAGES